MEQKADEWASDEVPFLLGEEKNSLEPPSRPNRRERWANILPYSVALNVVLLVLALLGLWNMQRHDASKHYIPNEIYSKQATKLLKVRMLKNNSTCAVGD